MSIRTFPTSAARHPPTSESHKLSAAIATKQQPFLGYTTLDPIWLWRVLYWFLCHRRIFCTLSNGLPTANYSGCMCSASQVTQLCHHWQITAAFIGRDGRGVVRCGRSVSPPLIQPRSIWRPYCIAMFGVISYHIYCFLLWPYRAITTGTNTCTRHWYVLTVWSLCGNAESRHAKRDKHKKLFVSFIVVVLTIRVVLVTTHELHMKNIISMHEVLIGKRH